MRPFRTGLSRRAPALALLAVLCVPLGGVVNAGACGPRAFDRTSCCCRPSDAEPAGSQSARSAGAACCRIVPSVPRSVQGEARERIEPVGRAGSEFLPALVAGPAAPAAARNARGAAAATDSPPGRAPSPLVLRI